MALDTYHFTLVVDLPEEDEDIDVLLFRSGCMDATASVQGGELVIDFARVAPPGSPRSSRPAGVSRI